MRIDFHGSAEPTLGVEWEFALVDRRTRDLRNDAAHLFDRFLELVTQYRSSRTHTAGENA